MTDLTILDGVTVKVFSTNTAGENFVDAVRRLGSIGGVAVAPTATDAQVMAALATSQISSFTPYTTAAAAALALNVLFPNGTLQRWLDLGGAASTNTKAALRNVENRLKASGLLPRIVMLGLPAGTSVASCRVPFYVAPGCGGLASLTGTIGSFTEASGLVLSGTTGLSTGMTLQSAALNQYDLGMGMYLLSNPNADTGYSIGGPGWGFSPYSGTSSFASSFFNTFDYYGRVVGDPRIDHNDGSTTYMTYVATGAMAAVRTSAGEGYVMRDGVSLQGGTYGTYPNDPNGAAFPTDVISVRANVAPLGGYWVTRGMSEAEMAMLCWIVDEFNYAIGRGADKSGL
jgi:hypothetical protein